MSIKSRIKDLANERHISIAELERKLDFAKRKDFIPEVTLNHQLRRAKEKFKINKKVDCHIFRHTHVSKLAELGIPLYVIQDHVGHADDQTTKLIYLHVTKKAQQKLDSQLDKLYHSPNRSASLATNSGSRSISRSTSDKKSCISGSRSYLPLISSNHMGSSLRKFNAFCSPTSCCR